MRGEHCNVLTEMGINREIDVMQMEGSYIKLFTYKSL